MTLFLSQVNPYPSFTDPRNIAIGARNSSLKEKIGIARKAYDGHYNPPLKTRPGGPNDNVIINLCAGVVDKSVAYLFGKPVTFNLDDSSTRSDTEKVLDRVWDRNNKDATLQKLATNGGICGQSFVKFRIEEDNIRLIVVDPYNVTVETAHDDFMFVNSYTIQWAAPLDPKTNKIRHYRQRINRKPAVYWEMEDGTPVDEKQAWSILDEYADVTVGAYPDESDWIKMGFEMWDYEFPPILETQNLPAPNSYWGKSDIEPDVISLNESINRSASNINKIIRNHAHPKTYTIGLEGDQAKRLLIDADNMLHIPGDPTQVKIDNLEMNSDLASSLNFYRTLREAMYEVSLTPEIASGKAKEVSYLSAMAMQILYGPMIEKTNAKQMTYGPFLKELNRRILVIMGIESPEPVNIVWPITFPRDVQVEVATAMNKLQVGFSSDTLVSELGGDPEYERNRRADDIGTLPGNQNQAPERVAQMPEIGKAN